MVIPEIEIAIGQGISAANAEWNFGGQVATEFGEHVRRSIPSYEAGHALVCQISDFFVHDDSVGYEIGTSQGELLAELAERHMNHVKARWVGLDVEPDMVREARARVDHLPNATVEEIDVVDYEFQKTDFVVSYYTLQFVAPKHRQAIIDNIYDSLNWGGAFVWFEKVRGSDARFQDMLTLLYHDFKLAQGFSPNEIMAKSRSLKGVLEPFSTEANLAFLERAGFTDTMHVFKYLSFEGLVAIK